MNNQKQEKYDGKDLTLNIDLDEDFDINIQLNVQVKQHEGLAGDSGFWQILKSDDSEKYTKNVLVTLATFKENEELKKLAKEYDVALIGVQRIAEMIYEHFDNIDDKWKPKLGLYKTFSLK